MEYKQLCLTILFSAICVHGDEISATTAPGTEINYGCCEYSKNLVALYNSETFKYCIGYLLTEKAIITAAHCFDTIPIAIGVYNPISDKNVTWRFVSEDIIVNNHQGYKKGTRQNDLVILSFLESLPYEPSMELTISNSSEYTNCIASGIRYEPKGQIYVLIQSFKEVEITTCQGEIADHICARAKTENNDNGNYCTDNAGALLMCDNKLVAIAVCDSTCANGRPGVFQTVKDSEEWIEDQVARAATLRPTSTSTQQTTPTITQMSTSTKQTTSTTTQMSTSTKQTTSTTTQMSTTTRQTTIRTYIPTTNTQHATSSNTRRTTLKPYSTTSSAPSLTFNHLILLTTIAITFKISASYIL